MKNHITFSLEEIESATNDSQGFCLACGELNDMVEPDARHYECEVCGSRQVFGAEELVLMGRVS